MAGNISLLGLCYQRKQQQKFNTPLSRYTPTNPYNGTFTQFQLDMRRKAEILKYSNNASSSKTNNLTKAEKYAQLINGRLPIKSQGVQSINLTTEDSNGIFTDITVKYPDKLILEKTNETDPVAVKIKGYEGFYKPPTIIPNGRIVNCSADRSLPTLTSSCDVPGPIMYLIDDETVPLYNFVNTSILSASYSSGSTNTFNSLWEIVASPNMRLLNNIPINIGSIKIMPSIIETSYNFTLQTPIGLYASGSPGLLNQSSIITISNIFLSVNYNNEAVPLDSFNISLSTYALNMPITVYYRELSEPYIGCYFATIDTFNISNILLNTTPGFIYDFVATLDFEISNNTSGLNNPILISNYYNKVDIRSELVIIADPLYPPTNLSVISKSNTTITVRFTPPISSDNTILYYTIGVNGSGSGPSPSGIASASSSSIILSGLSPNTYYSNIYVTAVYKNGQSTSITSLSTGTIDFNANFFSLYASSTTGTSFTVNFNIGSNPQILGYYVVAIPDSQSTNNQQIVNTFDINSLVTSAPLVVNKLISGSKYNLTLGQYLSTGEFQLLDQTAVGTTLSPSATNLIASNISYSFFDLSFSSPNSLGIGSLPAGYTVTTSIGSLIVNFIDYSNTPNPPLPIRISNLKSGTVYSNIITTIYNNRFLSFNTDSVRLNITTLYGPVNLLANGITDTSFNLNYTSAPGSLPTNYTISINPANLSLSPTNTTITTLPNPYLISNLIPETTYTIVVSSNYPAGSVQSSINVTTFYNGISDVIILRPSLFSLDIYFSYPTGLQPSGYYVTAVPLLTNNNQVSVTYPSLTNLFNSNSITIPQLISGTTYTISLVSVFSTGNKTSFPVQGNTLAYGPRNIAITNQTINSISVNCTLPQGSSPIGYFASYSSNGGQTYTNTSTQTGTSFIITSLLAGTSYNTNISAIYSNGNYASDTIIGNTSANPVTITSIIPDNQSFTIQFTPSQNQTTPNYYYAVAYPSTTRLNQQQITSSTSAGNSTSIQITGLTSGTFYNSVVVYSVYPNITVSSNTATGATLTPVPSILSATSTTDTITVTFSDPIPYTNGLTYYAEAVTAIGPETTYTNQILTSNTSITIYNLPPNTSYNIYVIAYYNNGLLGKAFYNNNPINTLTL